MSGCVFVERSVAEKLWVLFSYESKNSPLVIWKSCDLNVTRVSMEVKVSN